MKQRFKRFLSLALVGTMLSSLSVTALASDALGETLTEKEVVLHEDTRLATSVFWSQAYTDLRTENFITYSPNQDVTPVVTFGDVLTERSTLTAMARKLEEQGYRVVAGINGDYYNTTNGLPVGLVITDGQLRSSDGGYCALGFKANGTAVIGKPQLQVNADLGYAAYDEWGTGTQILRRITGVNKARVSDGGIYLYTYDFNDRHTTGNAEPGVDVLCTILDGELAVGETTRLMVEQVIEATGATAMAENQVVLSANLKSNTYFVDALRNVPLGTEITLTITAADEAWNEVEYAVGALYQLAEDGEVLSGLPAGVNPRTAVGRKADGDLVFYTIDGRKNGHSIGASLSQVAQRLIELGCEDVVAMDGGGSTTLAITEPSDTQATYINKPSDGSERKVTNQIFLVAENEPSGRLSHFYVETDRAFVLGGSKVNITASGVDTNYIPMDAKYTLSVSDGQLEDQVLTTPVMDGEITITAKGSNKKGTAAVEVVQTPEEVAVLRNGTAVEHMDMSIGSSVQLSVSAKADHRSLYFDKELVQWEADASIGTITEDGVFTAARSGEGEIRATLGDKTVSIPVKVARLYLETVEDFEGESNIFTNGSGNIAQFGIASGENVRLGYGAGQLDYTLTEELSYQSEWRISVPKTEVTAPYSGISLWVKGDGSGNELSFLYANDTKSYLTQKITALDFTGWKQVLVELPYDVFMIQGLRVTTPKTELLSEDGMDIIWEYADTPREGTIYIDQIMASYDGVVDNEVPVITTELDLEAATLTATVADAEDGLLEKSAISVKASVGEVKGIDVPFAYDKTTGQLVVDLPEDLTAVGAMRITVTARDASGNIGRASVDLTDESMAYAFTDIADYWGANFVNFLYTSGVTTGYADGTFRPNQNITRAQFSVMLYRYLGLAEENYAEVELPFADLESIPEYALPAIRALYTEGVINGSEGKDGRLYFNPHNNLTRAQAATMIGRTQEKGYALAELTFADAGRIPAYATYYIQTMAAQGIIGGYTDGTFKPNNNITRGQMAKILYNLM